MLTQHDCSFVICLMLVEMLLEKLQKKCFQVDFECCFFFLTNECLSVAMCLLSVPVLVTFCRIKHAYRHWKDMLRMCRVSASILNCQSLSQARKTVIGYFLVYEGKGKNLQETFFLWCCYTSPALGLREEIKYMYFFFLQELYVFGIQAPTGWKAHSTMVWRECGVWPV